MKHLLAAAALAACATSSSRPATEAQVAAPPAATQVAEGKLAPDFTLPDTDGHQVALHDLVKKGPVILIFFPKAFTGG